MKRMLIPLILVLILASCISPVSKNVREPAVAGYFYPNDSQELRRMVDSFLGNAERKVDGKVYGLISPHAGYVYSGSVAAYAYKQLEGKNYSTVIIIGPSHHVYFKGASIPNYTHYRTPLGEIPISPIAKKLLRESPFTTLPSAHEREHCIEVQLPFLQAVLRNFSIVPIVTGDVDPEELAAAIMKYWDEDTLIVASSDLSHYHPYDEAVRIDSVCLDAFNEKNLSKLSGCEMCGDVAVRTLMLISRYLNLDSKVLAYMNSGDVTGDMGRVVGYAAVAYYVSELSEKQKELLLNISRMTLEMWVNEGRMPNISVDDGELLRPRATFVTLTKHGMLRGCMGSVIPARSLYEDVMENTVRAASYDPRFAPVSPDEVDELEIEISILTIPVLITVDDPQEYLSMIRVGRDGLIVSSHGRQGLLLPQVPVEYGWDVKTFLDHVCEKAGLAPECWRDPSTRIYRFSAQVFREK